MNVPVLYEHIFQDDSTLYYVPNKINDCLKKLALLIAFFWVYLWDLKIYHVVCKVPYIYNKNKYVLDTGTVLTKIQTYASYRKGRKKRKTNQVHTGYLNLGQHVLTIPARKRFAEFCRNLV